MTEETREERLEDAIYDILDFTVGWCSPRLTDEQRLEKIRIIGYRVLGIAEDAK